MHGVMDILSEVNWSCDHIVGEGACVHGVMDIWSEGGHVTIL